MTIWGDFEAAASTDSLDNSMDYINILATVQETAHARECNLLETLAYGIARNILQAYPVNKVRVAVRKRPASLAGKIDFIEMEVEES